PSEPDLRRTAPCIYCGQFIPWRDLKNHLQTAHPDVVAAQAHWTKDSNRVWVRVAIPAFLLWFAALVYVIVSDAPSNIALVVLGSAFVALLRPFVYPRLATPPDIKHPRQLPHYSQ